MMWRGPSAGPPAGATRNELYQVVRRYVPFFPPGLKRRHTARSGGKVRKRQHPAQTSRRQWPIALQQATALAGQYAPLNPRALQTTISRLQTQRGP